MIAQLSQSLGGVTEAFLALTLACAVLTYATRAGGYLVLSRFAHIPPRLEAALNAVPAAVMTTLFAPAIFSGGMLEAAAIGLAFLLGLRFGLIVTVIGGTLALILARAMLGT